jgi:hypothetical protein
MNDRENADLARYLRGEDELSAAYQRLPSVAPPRIVDRQVLERARGAARRRPGRDTLAYAASALLALAVLFAFEIRPGERRAAQDAPHFLRTAMRSDHVGGWRAADLATGRAIDPRRCATRSTRPPSDTGGSARSPRGFRTAEASPNLREPCSPRGRLR